MMKSEKPAKPMPKLLKAEKDSIIDIIQTYRILHGKIADVTDGIAAIEKEMKSLHSKKDSIIAQIQANREQEGELMNTLMAKYGKGKLSIDDMTWLSENEDNENTTNNN